MSDIRKITIKGFSGYGPYDEAYEDKITLTTDSISYEYIPTVESEINPKRKWRYTTNSPIFSTTYDRISKLIEEILQKEIEAFCTDIGGMEFSLLYTNKSRVKKHYWLPADHFYEVVKLIRTMVPQTEYTPAVLLLEEDFSDK